ncbi:MAG TPA: FtsX-like permease family protein [Candidatus Dormibacteraeota bacterium]|nr:FtsX-like permease family protein [Candidatus Dormibacteraeota bacterium]
MYEILHNLTRRKLRSILTISGIVIGVFALTTMGALSERFNQQLNAGVEYYGSNVQVAAPDQQRTGLLPLSKMDQIKSVTGVVAVFPTYSFLVKPGTGFSFGGAPETIFNRIPDAIPYARPQVTIGQGQDLSTGGSGEVVLGTTLAKEFNKGVGDSIDLPVKPADAPSNFANHSFKVVGILNPTGTAPDGYAYVSTSDARMLLGDTLPPAINQTLDLSQVTPGFTVYGRTGASLDELDQIAQRINDQVTGVKATKPSVSVNGYKQFASLFTVITTAIGILALIIGGLSVVNTMVMAVSERFREIGLKKAVGARTTDVLREFLAEAAVIGLIGGLVGYTLGAALTLFINASSFAGTLQLFLLTPKLTILVIGFAVGLGALAGVVPAIRAARLDPVTALRTTN